jgi:hypothetical protein
MNMFSGVAPDAFQNLRRQRTSSIGLSLLCKYVGKRKFRLCFLVFVCLTSFSVVARADITPKSFADLNEAKTIIVGTVKGIRIEIERSSVERGFGNTDWAIYVTILIDEVEKGSLESSEVEVRCFRKNARRSAIENLSLTGHRPIPKVGTKVRVYLEGLDELRPMLPNGITLATANDDSSVWPKPGVEDAAEVSGLGIGRYTYFLPLEMYPVLLVSLLIGYGILRLSKNRTNGYKPTITVISRS